MSLILALGTNLGNKILNIRRAHIILSQYFNIIHQSKVYRSEPVDFLAQPEFLNQVVECSVPKLTPRETLQLIKRIELQMGSIKYIFKGPRIIDIDIIFWDNLELKTSDLIIPHPSWQQRDFVKNPLKELPFYSIKNNKF
jgi:2-amino-4-hydroxy-6-hydroxymethyldihydropteridine diphosphokinase